MAEGRDQRRNIIRRHDVLNRVTGRFVAFVAVSVLSLSSAAQEAKWKDQAEYDLVQGQIQKETNPQKKIQLLQQWEEKYPESDFKNNRSQAMLQTYQLAGDPQGMKKVATKMTVDDPNGVFGLVGYQTLNLLAVSMNDKSEAALSDADKAANGLMAIVDQVKKPEQVADEAWTKETQTNKALALRTKGWAAWQRKDYAAAQEAFRENLKINPKNGEISSWLGTVILLQRNPDKQSAGLYHFARAASLEGEGALPAAARQQAKNYVVKTYTNYHGSEDGLDEIMTRAKTEAFPPEPFVIESKAALQAKDRNKLMTENPELFKWLSLKDRLKAEGDTFGEALKGSDAGGTIKGKLVSATPETNPKELQLSIEDGITPDAIVRLTTPLKGKAEPGIDLEFVGSVKEYTTDPFSLTFDADPDQMKGWPTPPAAKPAARRPAKKK